VVCRQYRIGRRILLALVSFLKALDLRLVDRPLDGSDGIGCLPSSTALITGGGGKFSTISRVSM